ncbi:metalloproteinase inhibitor 4 [Rana temporaria]|uniref:metalloproteinase inhibitor 4 n=1 Tax=Rana temporaria TaxID=8407 RepID=UPI001AACE692|nr:metalloproteinase inhibitor 4 [Rana temporaria]
MNLFSHTLLVGTVFLLTLKELTEACSCISFHPQDQFCRASVVIHAKVISKRFIQPNHERGDGKVVYGIKLIEVFKGIDKNNIIDSAYTSSQSASCGVELNVGNQVEYLLSGYLQENKLAISLCGLAKPWNQVTAFQIKGIRGFYQMGCACKITTCYSESCGTSAPNECILNFSLYETGPNGFESQNLACIQRKDDSCMWYPTSPSYTNHP